MSCNLCGSIRPEKIVELNRLFRGGSVVEELAIKFQVPPDEIQRHCDECIDTSTKEKLERVLQGAFKQLRLAQKEHEADPGKQSAYAYTAILREVRELATQLESLRSDKTTYKEILEKSLFPFTMQMTGIFINELRAIRDEMYAITSKKDLVDVAVKRATIRTGQQLKEKQDDAMQIVASLLGVTGIDPFKELTDEERAQLTH